MSDESIVWVVPLTGSALPHGLLARDLEVAIAAGETTVSTGFVGATLRPSEEQHVRSIRIQQAAWARIKPLVFDREALEGIFSEERGAIISGRAQEVGCLLPQIYRDLHRFFANGMTSAALYPTFRSVARGTRQATGAKRGKKPSEGQHNLRITVDSRERIERFLIMNLTNDSTIDDLYERVLKKFYSKEELVANGAPLRYNLLPSSEYPTKGQFRRIFRQLNEKLRLTKLKKGARDWNNNFAAALGRTHHDLAGPGSRFEIDSTGTQVETTNEELLPLGPATIYLVIDTWSNLVVGYFVGMGAASWDGARTALFCALSEDKTDFCAYYGISIQPADWPGGIPYSVIADSGGEFTGNASDSVVESVNLAFTQARLAQCRDRADGERTNGTIKTQLLKHLVGAHPKFNVGRGSKDPRMSAGYTIYELNQEIIRWILHFNRCQPVTFDAMPPKAKADNVKPTRVHLWNWGIENLVGPLRTVPSEQLNAALLQRDEKARFDIDGLRSRGFRYTADVLEDQNVFSRVRLGLKNRPPKVHYNPSRPDRCHLWDPDRDTFIECKRIAVDFPVTYSEYDVAFDQARHLEQVRALEHDRLSSAVDRQGHLEHAQVRAKARVEARTTETRRKTANKTGVRAARAEAVKAERIERGELEASGYQPAPAPAASPKPTSKLSKLREQDIRDLQAIKNEGQP